MYINFIIETFDITTFYIKIFNLNLNHYIQLLTYKYFKCIGKLIKKIKLCT